VKAAGPFALPLHYILDGGGGKNLRPISRPGQAAGRRDKRTDNEHRGAGGKAVGGIHILRKRKPKNNNITNFTKNAIFVIILYRK
jgi:hypothetical protein